MRLKAAFLAFWATILDNLGMARIARNELSIVALPNGLFKLFGYWQGKRIRMQSPDLAKLEAAKEKIETPEEVPLPISLPKYRQTTLTDEQLREAEAAIRQAGVRRLLDCVTVAERFLGNGQVVPCATAKDDWLDWLKSVRRYERTIDKNRLRVVDFLDYSGCEHLQDITPDLVEKWALRKNRASLTQLEDARVLSSWLSFCVRKNFLAINPVSEDLMANLVAVAKPQQPPRILTPAQSNALLQAAATQYDGSLLPYVILSLWCFMRHAEVERTTGKDFKLDGQKPLVKIRPRKRGTVSYRTVDIPLQFVEALKSVPENEPVFYTRYRWDRIRAKAGLLELGELKKKRRGHVSSIWQENLLRHTGISYLYQRDRDIKETCRQAGNSDDTAFRHYLDLPAEGDAEKFYAIKILRQKTLEASVDRIQTASTVQNTAAR